MIARHTNRTGWKCDYCHPPEPEEPSPEALRQEELAAAARRELEHYTEHVRNNYPYDDAVDIREWGMRRGYEVR